MLRTRVCDQLGIEAPIFSAPMGPAITTPELAAAVSNAGGLGVISWGHNPPDVLRQLIRRIRELTDKPFGVNFIVALAPQEEQIAVCIAERVPVLSFFWGDPAPYVERAHAANLKVINQVGSVAAAKQSVAAGVDVVIAQGHEAGGHVAGQVGTLALVPRVVDAIAPTPVVAAGGIADGRGLAAALALGAEAVVLGTRLIATTESGAHPIYKQRVLAATEEDTVYTKLFGGGWPDAPHRVIRTPFVEAWQAQEMRGQEQRPDEPIIGQDYFFGQMLPVPRFGAVAPSTQASGEIEAMTLLAGQGVGLVREIKPAGEVVREIVQEAEQIIAERLAALTAMPLASL